MRVGAIVLKLRLANTRFKNYIGGAAEFQAALRAQVNFDSLFIIPLLESADANRVDSEVIQKLTERFGVIVLLKNDRKQIEKTGIIAADQLHNIRKEILGALLGWEIPDAESMVYFRGGRLLDMTPSYLWYQYEFEYTSRITEKALQTKGVESQSKDIHEIAEKISDAEAGLSADDTYNNLTAEQLKTYISAPDDVKNFNTIYMQLLQSPSADLPYTGDLPRADDYPDVSLPNMANWIDMTKHPSDGEYGAGFGSKFDVYTG